MRQNDFLEALSRAGSKDKARMSFAVIFVIICGIGIGSAYFFGADNAVEEEMEEIAEEMIQIKIELPGEPPMHGFIDFTPSTPEKKRAQIDNS